MKYILILFLVNLTMCSVASAAVSNISQIVFVSEAQTVAPDSISKAFTIQTQNASGAVEPIDETADLSVTIDSSTGQFNSNSATWNPATTFTMSKGTGNKNFYFKDSTVGNYTITATLTTRTTAKSWSTTQAVSVGTAVISTSTTATTTTATSTTPGSSTGTVSTHYIVESVSIYTEPEVFELSAGRDRLGHVGAPLTFKVKSRLSNDLKNMGCHYTWNFGDGAFAKKEETEHKYSYPGEYNLVLNGVCGDSRAVSRSKVKIVEPDIFLSKNVDGAVKITNSSQYEINLFNWRLVGDRQEYVFPQDTIIGPDQAVVFSSEATGVLNPEKTSLLAPDGKVTAIWLDILSPAHLDTISLEEFQLFIESIKQLTFSQN